MTGTLFKINSSIKTFNATVFPQPEEPKIAQCVLKVDKDNFTSSLLLKPNNISDIFMFPCLLVLNS